MTIVLDLPVDVFLPVFSHLSIKDILNIRQVGSFACHNIIAAPCLSSRRLLLQTCRDFYDVTRLHSVWHMLLRAHIQLENVPVPKLSGRSVDLLTAAQLEKYVFEALRLRHNWRTASPRPKRRLEIASVAFSRIVFLQFLPGRGNRWLLSLALNPQDGTERKFTLQCWDLEASPPVCIATKTLLQFGSLIINTDDSSTAALAVQSPLYAAFSDASCHKALSRFLLA